MATDFTAGKRVVSGMSMTYDGKTIERGEVFTLTGALNDVKLIEHRYLREFSAGTPEDCECGKEFANEGHLRNHQREQHPIRERIEVGGKATPKRTPDALPKDRKPDPVSDRDFDAREMVL